MHAARSDQRYDPAGNDLFAVAAALRAAEIQRYKADLGIRAPVLLSLRGDPKAQIKWSAKF